MNATNRHSYLNIIYIKLVTHAKNEKKKNYNSDLWLEVLGF